MQGLKMMKLLPTLQGLNMINRGRNPRTGETHGRAKPTNEHVVVARNPARVEHA